MARLKLRGLVKELARNLQLQSRKGEHWSFFIPDSVQHLGSRQLVSQLQSELSSQLGQTVNLHLKPATEPVTSPAAISEQANMQMKSEAELAISGDPTVKNLQERFGARLVEDSIQPLQ